MFLFFLIQSCLAMSPMSKIVSQKMNWLLICPSVYMSLKIMEKNAHCNNLCQLMFKKRKKEAKHSYKLMSKFYKKRNKFPYPPPPLFCLPQYFFSQDLSYITVINSIG